MAKKGPSSLEDRLHRIEGQVRGVEKLIKADEPAEKIAIQLQAVISSLESVKLELIKKQMKEKLMVEVDSLVNLLK